MFIKAQDNKDTIILEKTETGKYKEILRVQNTDCSNIDISSAK